jgi:hypothetical protein
MNGADAPPHPAGWRVTFIMAGADGQKALVVAFATSHLKQGSRVSFQDQSRGRMFLLQSWLKNEIARQGGHHLTPPPVIYIIEEAEAPAWLGNLEGEPSRP